MKNDTVAMLAAFAVAGVAGPVQVASAQQSASAQSTNSGADTLGEVLVTAQRREENLQSVPIAVTSVSAADLEASNVRSVQDLATLVSGFIGPGDNGMQSPHLRGIGSQVGAPGLENSVALYVDGIYIGATTPALLSLKNIQQVEVLKGPQGTLFGRNTTGGLIQLTTRDPGDATELEAELGFGNYQTKTAAVYASTPVGSNVSTNLAFQISQQGQGWGTNILSGEDVYRFDSSMSLRNKWNIQIGESTDLQLIADYEKIRETGTFAYRTLTGSTVRIFNGPPNVPATFTSNLTGYDVYSNTNQFNRTQAHGFSGRLSHDFGFAVLSDTLAYRRSTFDLNGFDAEKTPLDNFTIDWFNTNKQWTNELQLASTKNERLNWTAGVFYYHAVDNVFQPLTWGTLAPQPPFGKIARVTTTSEVTSKSIAGYVQADYKIASATTLTAGFRYSNDDHEIASTHDTITTTGLVISNPPVNDDFTKDAQVWRLALSQKLTDDALVYGSFNRGVKAGGYNPIVGENLPYDDELIDTFELGSKVTFLDNRARVNVAAFYNKYKNIQVQKFQPAGAPTIYNGPSAKSYGVDADFELRPVSQFKIRGTLEVLRSEFGDFPGADILVASPLGGYVPAPAGSNAEGNDLPYAPEFTASVAPTYSIPAGAGSVDVSATWSYSSGFTTTPGLELSQESYSLIAASVQYTDSADRYFARLWGSNLGDEEVAMQLGLSAVGNNIGLLAPRTYGVTVGVKFK